TQGGTGALRLGAELIATVRPRAKVWLGEPTWPNHRPLLNAARLAVEGFKHFDRTSQTALFDETMGALARADTTDPIVRQEIATLEMGYRIGRILVIRESLKQAPPGFSAATKCFCTDHEWRVAQFVSKIFGAEAMLWNDLTQGVAYAPAYTIMGGTKNIMLNIIGERVLGLPKEPAVLK
ncbi:MAG: aminotransferase class I/II-fold pyridoxal phosphate-dependent enzyme, partial [Actinomycetota bacterium]